MHQAIRTPRAGKVCRELYAAWKSFKGNAGYCTPPGRAACALDLARAERWAKEEGIEFRWEDDPEEWQGDCDRPAAVYCCTAIDEDGNVLASLCGIGFDSYDVWAGPRSDYARVVEAELAAQAMHEAGECHHWAARDVQTA